MFCFTNTSRTILVSRPIDPPDPNNYYSSWANVTWTIVNGTIDYSSNSSISFHAGTNGQPTTITATATDIYGCTNSASITPPPMYPIP